MIRTTLDYGPVDAVPPKVINVVYAPTISLSEVKSIRDFVSIEIPVTTLDRLLETPEPDAPPEYGNYANLISELEGWVWYPFAFEAFEVLDQVVDFNELPLNALRTIRDEYDEAWFSQEDDTLPDELQDEIRGVLAIRDKIDSVIQHKEALETISKRFVCLKPGKAGYVYLLRSVTGHWKIGRATDPNNRLKTFGIQLPFEVEFEHLIPTDNMHEAELMLHEHFASKRLRGEWFNLSPEDIAYIKAIQRI